MAAIGAVTLFVEDARRSREWYERALGFSLYYEDAVSAVMQLDNLLVNLLEVTEAPELVGPAAVGRRGGGARSLLTMWVQDTEGVHKVLTGRGVEFVNGPLDRPWGMRTACFADPDGHLWELAQSLAPPGP
jgi:catechol 2,3-dioxygenase-like lactoylglutathione lyase family enzyme